MDFLFVKAFITVSSYGLVFLVCGGVVTAILSALGFGFPLVGGAIAGLLGCAAAVVILIKDQV